jgi:hypothetical protein
MWNLNLEFQFTPQQKELARNLHEKWMTVAKCTERIDRPTTTDAINAVYLATAIRKVPKIIFADSPRAAIEMAQPREKCIGQSSPNIIRYLKIALSIGPIENIPYESIDLQQPSTQKNDLGFSSNILSMGKPQLLSVVSIQFWARYAWFLDCAYSVLGCDYIPEKWQALQLLVTRCGFILPFKDIAIEL